MEEARSILLGGDLGPAMALGLEVVGQRAIGVDCRRIVVVVAGAVVEGIVVVVVAEVGDYSGRF